MNILLLTPQLPYPPVQGAAIRNYHVLRHLASEHRVSLLSFTAPGQDSDLGDLPALCASVDAVPAPCRTRRARFHAMLTSGLPDMALRLHSSQFLDRLARLRAGQHFDVVHVEGIEMAHYALPIEETGRNTWRLRGARDAAGSGGRGERETATVFDDHNAEYLLQRRAFETDARSARHAARALYSLVQWRRLRRYEADVVARYRRVIAVSEADRVALQRLVPGGDVTVIPNGVDAAHFLDAGAGAREADDLLFVGTMDYRPNVDAVLWFARTVLPRIWRQEPGIRFWVVGQRPTAEVRRLGADSRVVVTGGVPDIRPFFAEHGVCVIPMRVGGGTRFKALEAMAMGKGIVSTSFGCEGLGVTGGKHVVLADQPEVFAQECLRLLHDRAERERLGAAARRFVVDRFDWRAIVPLLSQVYESLQPGNVRA